ncbi:MAG: hypothetical protein M0P58_13585 [Bacteroidales bacterium]|nr:hypothetical protein [Bacteroidales bacterium]
MNPGNELFTSDGHLTEEGIALCVESATENSLHILAPKVSDHLNDCPECKRMVFDTINALENSDSFPRDEAPLHQDRGFIRKFHPAYMIAATLLVLLCLTILLLYVLPGHRPDNQALFEQYFKPYPDMVSMKNAGTGHANIQGKLVYAMSLYADQRFDSAFILLSRLHFELPSNDTVSFYLGNTILASGKEPDAARLLFGSLSKKPSGLFYTPSRWYSSLIWIKLGKPGLAKPLLIELQSGPVFYKDKADSLLKSMRTR